MRKTVGVFAASVVTSLAICAVPSIPSTPAQAASVTEPVAVVIEGEGNGHGIGLSQWGAFGRAVNGGQSWEQILGAYYGGTHIGSVGPSRVTVRITALDDQQTAVVSFGAGVSWGGHVAATMVARQVSPNVYDVFSAGTPWCPGSSDPLAGWSHLGTATGPIVFANADGSDGGGAADQALGLCEPAGTVRHYRGALIARDSRTVNDVDIDAYLRGVVPREVPAGWGDAPGGMNALYAQAVAARSYALRQSRYSYAMTCDTQACQVYGGAATRPNTSSAATSTEAPQTNDAIAGTSGRVLRWNSDGTIVSAMFSASNGGASAGALFPAIDDPWDLLDANPNARWTRVIDAGELASRFGIAGTLTSATMQPDPSLTGQGYVGDWANRAVFNATGGSKTVTAASLRSAYALPSTALTVRVVTRDLLSGDDFVMIGDSVGQGVANGGGGPLVSLLNGVYATAGYDNAQNRRVVCSGCTPSDGVTVANSLPGSPDIAIVQLGYNDGASLTAARIDQMMNALVAKGVRTVGWVGLSERNGAYKPVNDLLVAAQGRWPQLRYLDWNAASSCSARNRWFRDNVHLTSTGYAEFALWLRDRALELGGGSPGAGGTEFSLKLCPGSVLRLPLDGIAPAGAAAASLNVTAAEAEAWGYVTVWPCGAPMPEASNLNFVAGDTVPNAVIAPLDGTKDLCFYSYAATHLIVDLNGWFTAGLGTTVPDRLLDTRNAVGAPSGKVQPSTPVRLKVAGTGVVPAGVAAVSLNVTVAEADGWGYVTVWPCAAERPVASNLNYVGGDTVPNAVIAPVDANGEICLYTYAPVHLIVDINGWFTGGLGTTVPTRLLDTRNAIGAPAGKVTPGAPVRLKVAGAGPVPAEAKAVSLNVTATEADAWGYVTVWPCASARPEASNLNYVRGDTVPNAVIAPVDANGEICLYSYAPTHLLVDLNGWLVGDGFTAVVPTRISDTRNGISPGR